MEFSLISLTREPGIKIVHPGLKRQMILYDRATLTLTDGACPRKWVPLRLTHSASRGYIIPAWIQLGILTLVSPYSVTLKVGSVEYLSKS